MQTLPALGMAQAVESVAHKGSLPQFPAPDPAVPIAGQHCLESDSVNVDPSLSLLLE